MPDGICCERCKNAKPKSPCKCRCKGQFHGSKNMETEYPPHMFKRFDIDSGGKIGEYIKRIQGKCFECSCRKQFRIMQFLGYDHTSGISDSTGIKYWVFVVCPHCNYEWSYGKLENRLVRQEKYEQIKIL